MTPIEKAKELVEKYWDCSNYNAVTINYNPKTEKGENNLLLAKAKSLALICCEEIIALLDNISHDDVWVYYDEDIPCPDEYWQSVKREIEKM